MNEQKTKTKPRAKKSAKKKAPPASGDYSAVIETALSEGKAEDIVSLPTLEQSGGLFARMFVATAGNPRHAAALGERVAKALKQAGCRAPAVESSDEREWILIDAGDALVHIMQPAARARYDLESLWRFEPPHGE